MIVPISQGCSSDDHPPEWGMIELNGEIVYPQQFDHDKENNNDVVGENRVELGSLRFSDKVKDPWIERMFPCCWYACVCMCVCVSPLLFNLFVTPVGGSNHDCWQS